MKKLRKRADDGTFYLGSSSPVVMSTCSLAESFTIANGQLSSGGDLLSADFDTAWESFSLSSITGDITTTFGILDNKLYWNYATFEGGHALFCEMPNGQINTLFRGLVDVSDPTYPLNCTEVDLILFQGKSNSFSILIPHLHTLKL